MPFHLYAAMFFKQGGAKNTAIDHPKIPIRLQCSPVLWIKQYILCITGDYFIA